MLSLIAKGGPVMIFLLTCSLVGLYVIIQKLIFLKSNQLSNALMVEKVKNQVITAGKQQTYRQLAKDRRIMVRVMAGAVQLSDFQQEELSEKIKELTYQEIPKLEQNMNLLASIITVAPILGLLGTVLGLMDIFNVISGTGLGDPSALAGGIATALITTVTGLSIAIPFIFINQYLSHKIDMFILDMERVITGIISFCKEHSGVKP